MPGYVIHMAVASRVLEEKGVTNSSFINAFLLGNIIPDAMERNEKKDSHFWDDNTYKNLDRIPNLDNFLKKYRDRLNDPFILGYYTHLLLDNLFVKDYWSEHFQLLDENMLEDHDYDLVRYIKVFGQNKVYKRDEFFSDELYYGDYDRIHPYIFTDWPFICLQDYNISSINIEEIELKKVLDNLKGMIDRINNLYHRREECLKQELKIFDLKHIYTLMDRVVSDVCEII